MFVPKFSFSLICQDCYWASPAGQRKKAQQEQAEKWSGYKQQTSVGVNLEKGMLRKLLQLCHPDKHNGSELATSVTQELLKLKEKL